MTLYIIFIEMNECTFTSTCRMNVFMFYWCFLLSSLYRHKANVIHVLLRNSWLWQFGDQLNSFLHDFTKTLLYDSLRMVSLWWVLKSLNDKVSGMNFCRVSCVDFHYVFQITCRSWWEILCRVFWLISCFLW